MIYAVHGQLEDRDHIIGYFEGDHDDVEAYIDHKYADKFYGTTLMPLKPVRVPAGYTQELRKLEQDKARLEQSLKELNQLIDLKR
jgi:hypothetical protein